MIFWGCQGFPQLSALGQGATSNGREPQPCVLAITPHVDGMEKGYGDTVEDFMPCPVSRHSQGVPFCPGRWAGAGWGPGEQRPARQRLEPLSVDGFLFLNYALISSPSGTNAYVLMSSLP